MFVVARAPLHAPKQEIALLANAVNLLVRIQTNDGEFHGPSIEEFFPDPIAFEGTPFEINRIILVRWVAVIALLLVFWLGTRRMKVVPGRFQSLVEMGLDLVRVNIADDLLGKKDGRRFLPLLTTIFFLVLFMNLTGVIPFRQTIFLPQSLILLLVLVIVSVGIAYLSAPTEARAKLGLRAR